LESLFHAGAKNETQVDIISIHSEEVDHASEAELLSKVDGVLVAPGFGERGIEGKITAVQYARENKIPFLGICLGMQMAVIEYARNCAGIVKANSTEMDPDCEAPVIDLMESQKNYFKQGWNHAIRSVGLSVRKRFAGLFYLSKRNHSRTSQTSL